MAAPDSRTVLPFPTRYPPAPVLMLHRRHHPMPSAWETLGWQQPPPAASDSERWLQRFEQTLAERERALAEAEARLAERTRDLDEMEALLRAREALLASTRLRDTRDRGVVTFREAEALHQLKDELDRQEISLREARQAIREREKFLEESEARLFAKVQEQQEKETELEQREEDLRHREAALSSGKKTYDEFRE